MKKIRVRVSFQDRFTDHRLRHSTPQLHVGLRRVPAYQFHLHDRLRHHAAVRLLLASRGQSLPKITLAAIRLRVAALRRALSYRTLVRVFLLRLALRHRMYRSRLTHFRRLTQPPLLARPYPQSLST